MAQVCRTAWFSAKECFNELRETRLVLGSAQGLLARPDRKVGRDGGRDEGREERETVAVDVEALGDEGRAATAERVLRGHGAATGTDAKHAGLVERLEDVLLDLLDHDERRLAEEVLAAEVVGGL